MIHIVKLSADDVRVGKRAKDPPVGISELKLQIPLLSSNGFFEGVYLSLHIFIVFPSDVPLNRDGSLLIESIK